MTLAYSNLLWRNPKPHSAANCFIPQFTTRRLIWTTLCATIPLCNHPFVQPSLFDGNKRTAFAAMDTFLRSNGYSLTFSNDRAYELVLQAAQGQISKEDLAEILRSNTALPWSALFMICC